MSHGSRKQGARPLLGFSGTRFEAISSFFNVHLDPPGAHAGCSQMTWGQDPATHFLRCQHSQKHMEAAPWHSA